MSAFLSYKIAALNVNKFQCSPSIKDGEVSIENGYSFQINMRQSLIRCNSYFKYTQQGEIIMDLDIDSLFEIERDSLTQFTEDCNVVLPPNILQYLATIAVGAARGEIHARAQALGSPVQDLVLPPINLTKIITEPSVFAIQ